MKRGNQNKETKVDKFAKINASEVNNIWKERVILNGGLDGVIGSS
jgi:hypothetical protein